MRNADGRSSYIQKPSSISFDEAASIPLTLATAMQGFYGDRKSSDIFKLPPSWEAGGEGAAKGKTVVVLGGSSSVGQFGGYYLASLFLWRIQ